MKYYILYKTTNLITGQYYIGKHETDNLDDNYLGSGLRLNRAIKKYGKENFKKEILCFLENSAILNDSEKMLINEHLENPKCYNLAPGGQGGHVYAHYTEEDKKNIYAKISKTLKRKKIAPPRPDLKGRTLSDEHKRKISESQKGRKKPTRSAEHCRNISKSLKGKKLSKNMKLRLSNKMKQNHANHKELTCPHCMKNGKSGSMYRWHFDNCKNKRGLE